MCASILLWQCCRHGYVLKILLIQSLINLLLWAKPHSLLWFGHRRHCCWKADRANWGCHDSMIWQGNRVASQSVAVIAQCSWQWHLRTPYADEICCSTWQWHLPPTCLDSKRLIACCAIKVLLAFPHSGNGHFPTLVRPVLIRVRSTSDVTSVSELQSWVSDAVQT